MDNLMRQKIERILPYERYEFIGTDFFMILKRLAAEKGVKVEKAVTSPRTDKWLKRAALFFGISLGVLVAIHILIVAVRG